MIAKRIAGRVVLIEPLDLRHLKIQTEKSSDFSCADCSDIAIYAVFETVKASELPEPRSPIWLWCGTAHTGA